MKRSKEYLEKIWQIYLSLPWWAKIVALLLILYLNCKVIPILAQILQAVAFVAVTVMIFLSQFSNEEMEKKINEFSECAHSYLKGEHIEQST